MKLLLFSDVHCDHHAARSLVERSGEADVLVCAGDLAVMREGLDPVVEILSESRAPVVLVAGNGESDAELAAACEGWDGAHVLHGAGVELHGARFWGVGGATPVTPFGPWSFDLDENAARGLLAECPEGAVLVTHSPPYGHVDTAGGEHLGSRAVLETIERASPRLVVCGHIHACWTQESSVGSTRIVNAGPGGVWAEI
jgi:uncharacterized protein